MVERARGKRTGMEDSDDRTIRILRGRLAPSGKPRPQKPACQGRHHASAAGPTRRQHLAKGTAHHGNHGEHQQPPREAWRMKQYTTAEKRFFENATFIGAQRVLFAKLASMGVPVFKLGELAETMSGGTPDRNNSSYFGGSIPWLKSGELTDGLVTEIEETITESGLANSNAKVFPVGTLLI